MTQHSGKVCINNSSSKGVARRQIIICSFFSSVMWINLGGMTNKSLYESHSVANGVWGSVLPSPTERKLIWRHK